MQVLQRFRIQGARVQELVRVQGPRLGCSRFELCFLKGGLSSRLRTVGLRGKEHPKAEHPKA